jgi:hypothetical protein
VGIASVGGERASRHGWWVGSDGDTHTMLLRSDIGAALGTNNGYENNRTTQSGHLQPSSDKGSAPPVQIIVMV